MIKIIISIFLISTSYLNAKWDLNIEKDEMTNEKNTFISSPMISPTKEMSFPYSSVKAWIGIGCSNNNTWAYIGFTSAPNITNYTTENGFNTFKTRIKFNEKIEHYFLSQEWGSKFIHFNDDLAIIKKIKESNSMLLELNWHGNSKTYFKFSLKGSSSAIYKSFEECGFSLDKLNNKKKLTDGEKCIRNGGIPGWNFNNDTFKCTF